MTVKRCFEPKAILRGRPDGVEVYSEYSSRGGHRSLGESRISRVGTDETDIYIYVRETMPLLLSETCCLSSQS